MYSRKGVGPRNGALRNSSINWKFLRRLSIQNHSKPSITVKRRNNAKNLTWKSLRFKFMKKTSMPNPVKRLGYIKCHSLTSPRPVKSPTNSIRYHCEKTSTVVFDRTSRTFNRSGATQAVAFDISKDFDRVWHAGLRHK